MSDTIEVMLLGGWVCKEPHPQQIPTLPNPVHFSERPKYFEALVEYHEQMIAYVKTDATLKKYSIETLKCESGLVVKSRLIDFKPYRGQLRTAVIVGEGKVQIIPTPKPARK